MANKIDEFELPEGLLWSDEYPWTGVFRAMETSVTGVPLIQTTTLPSGRPITFDGKDRSAWFTRTELDSLNALAALSGDRVLTLHDGRNVKVQFLEPPFVTEPLIGYDDIPDPGDKYVLLKLSLITTDAMQLPEEPEEP